MFGQSLLSAFGIACTTDTDQLFNPTSTQINSTATYQLNNATTSIPSNTYPGTASNITYAAGKFGNAAVFNGSSSYINNGFIPSLITQTFTISAWVKFSTLTDNQAFISNYVSSGGTSRGWFLRYQISNGIQFAFRNSTTDVSLSNNYQPTINEWVHVCVSVSATSKTLYINGASNATLGADNIIYLGNQETYLGRLGILSLQYFGGSIDQVRIFNTALSQAAVTALYNETTTTAQNAYITEEVYNGIAYYKMSDATDQLGNYNGTATNVNFNTEGKFGFAGAFNGSSSYISASIPFLNARVTSAVSLWIKYTDTGAYRSVFNDYSNNANFNHNIIVNQPSTGNLRFFSAYGGNTGYKIIESSGLTLNDGNWHHIVSTVDLSTNTLTGYVDGVSVGNVTVSTNAWTGTTQNLQIGRQEAGAYFNGSIDQIRIYDSALSAADVSKLYKEIECEPVAINALDQFNTVLYTGDGASSRSITGVGFAPDFTWTKKRGPSTANHLLQNTVQGAGTGSALYSASTGTAGSIDQYGYISAFNTDGVTYQAGSSGSYPSDLNNENNSTYVAWNWKAPLANLSSGFNGSSSYIDLDGALANGNTGNFSISMWVKITNSSSQYRLFATDISPYYSKLAMNIETNGTLRANFGNGTNQEGSAYSTISTWGNNTWQHLTYTMSWNGSNFDLKFYHNGVLDSSHTTGSTAISVLASSKFILGGVYRQDNATYYPSYLGSINQVRIFNDALTASEVSDLYAEPAASNNTLNYPAGAGCIAAYPLQTDAVDLSGNYNGASSNVTFGQPGYLTQNTEGTITSTVAANVDAGFSVVKYTGTGSNASFGHGLSSLPELVIVKRTNATEDWFVLYDTTNTPPNYMKLNTTSTGGTSSGVFPSPATSTVVNVGNDTSTNSSGSTYIAYCFKSIPGYSKIGSYIGTGATGNSQYLGFEPSFLMWKAAIRPSGGGSWYMYDNKRTTSNPQGQYLQANESAAEADGSSVFNIDFNSNGFTINGTNNEVNQNGSTYIFLAIA